MTAAGGLLTHLWWEMRNATSTTGGCGEVSSPPTDRAAHGVGPGPRYLAGALDRQVGDCRGTLRAHSYLEHVMEKNDLPMWVILLVGYGLWIVVQVYCPEYLP